MPGTSDFCAFRSWRRSGGRCSNFGPSRNLSQVTPMQFTFLALDSTSVILVHQVTAAKWSGKAELHLTLPKWDHPILMFIFQGCIIPAHQVTASKRSGMAEMQLTLPKWDFSRSEQRGGTIKAGRNMRTLKSHQISALNLRDGATLGTLPRDRSRLQHMVRAGALPGRRIPFS